MKTLLQDVKQFVLRNPDRAELVLKLIDPVMKAAQKNGTVSGSDLFGNFGESLYKSNDPRLYPIALKLCNTLNFQPLPGNSMFLEGTFSNGKQFDQEQNKNKVVLVYFWATWCTACRSIYPEIYALYNRYHQKGLEVFVYSLDSDVNALKLYEQQQKLPWPVVSEHLSIQNGQKKLSEHYGISLIPTLVLIDRNGKVISADIKMPVLAQELEKIFENGEE
ncbi:MAG: TlpA disulfide reductase family protein [Fibrobacter sp.]|nr:TlpA disulfide reductase family protein [Fibrobacter sp.]